MKNLYKLSFILFLCALMACNDDDDLSPGKNEHQDIVKPIVYLLSPAANTTFLITDRVGFRANLSDNMGLQSIRIIVVEADGTRRVLREAPILSIENRQTNYWDSFYLRGSEPGTLTLVAEVKDQANNMAKDSVILKVHAPDLNTEAFAKAFEDGSFFHHLDYGWFGLDFSKGIEFTEEQFNMGLYLMIGYSSNIRQHEWEKFMQDFRFEKQSWSTWDENSDGELEWTEFGNGIKRLDLFKKWDTNNDRMVRSNEFVKGVFDAWDQNRDNMLTRAEYQDKFYYYLAYLRD